MALDVVIRNRSATADAFFYNADGVTPFVGTVPASFVVRSPAGLLITNGSGVQDISNPAHWSASFSVPGSAPITSGSERYSITWSITAPGSSQGSSERFVVSDPEAVNPIDDAILVEENSNFSLSLVIGTNELATLSLRIINEKGAVFLTPMACGYASEYTVTDNGNGQYSYTVPVTVPLNSLPAKLLGVCSYLAVFNYTLPDGTQQAEYQPVYVINPRLISLMQAVRRQVDRIRNGDFIPQLQFTDIDLINCLLQGYQYFNSIPPANGATFTPVTLPDNFYMFVENCAIIKLLEAQYLAEGMTAFNFQGQAVQLDVDRTQYIAAQIDRLENNIQNHAGKAKNHWMRSGGGTGKIGAVGGVWGPVSNIVFRVSPLSMPGGYPVMPFMN